MLGLGGGAPLGFSLGGPGGIPPSKPTARGNTGTDIRLGNRSEHTGRFNFVIGDDGDVQFDQTEAHGVMTSVLEERGNYWADSSHGSDLLKLRSLTRKTPSQAEAMILDAVSGLVEDDAITGVKASAVINAKTGSLTADLTWTTPTSDEPFAEKVEL